MSHRRSRSIAFLDDPSAYPEFQVLIGRNKVYHSVVWILHRNRTAALLALLGVCLAASGEAVPALPGGIFGGDSQAGTAEAWMAYFVKGLALELLARHFEGIASAVCCMGAITAGCLLVYPLTVLTTNWTPAPAGESGPGGSFHLLTAGLISVGFPSAFAWGVAVWGARFFRWGLASGVAVGLQCAAATMKSWSFFHRTAAAVGKRTIAEGQGGPAGRHQSSAPIFLLMEKTTYSGIPETGPSGRTGTVGGGREEATSTTPGSYAKARTPGSVVRDPDMSPDRSTLYSAVSVGDSMTFLEFASFLLLTPSLVCEPRLLKRPARRSPSFRVAFSELLHAALVYLAVHAYAVAVYAPAFRVLSAAYGSTSWAEFDSMVRCCRRGEISGGGGGWVTAVLCQRFSWAGDVEGDLGSQGEACGGIVFDRDPGDALTTERLAVVALGVLSGICLSSPMMHFLLFYAFFHCVCVGCGELWGYPDRNTYGPWWLITDSIADFYVLWSAPVNRWLHAGIYRPILAAGSTSRAEVYSRRPEERRTTPPEGAWGNPLSERFSSTDIDVGADADLRNGRESNLAHGGSKGGSDLASFRGGGVAVEIDKSGPSFRRRLAAKLSVFLASGVIHEAVGYVAMRGTFRPINTMFLLLAAPMVLFWDLLFPVLNPGARVPTSPRKTDDKSVARGGENPQKSDDGRCRYGRGSIGQPAESPVERTSQGGRNGSSKGEPGKSRASGGNHARPCIGSWRGWHTVYFYVFSYLLFTCLLDYLLWEWWRWTYGPAW